MWFSLHTRVPDGKTPVPSFLCWPPHLKVHSPRPGRPRRRVLTPCQQSYLRGTWVPLPWEAAQMHSRPAVALGLQGRGGVCAHNCELDKEQTTFPPFLVQSLSLLLQGGVSSLACPEGMRNSFLLLSSSGQETLGHKKNSRRKVKRKTPEALISPGFRVSGWGAASPLRQGPRSLPRPKYLSPVFHRLFSWPAPDVGSSRRDIMQHSFGSFGLSNPSRKGNNRNPDWKRCKTLTVCR